MEKINICSSTTNVQVDSTDMISLDNTAPTPSNHPTDTTKDVTLNTEVSVNKAHSIDGDNTVKSIDINTIDSTAKSVNINATTIDCKVQSDNIVLKDYKSKSAMNKNIVKIKINSESFDADDNKSCKSDSVMIIDPVVSVVKTPEQVVCSAASGEDQPMADQKASLPTDKGPPPALSLNCSTPPGRSVTPLSGSGSPNSDLSTDPAR